ncbi:MAG: glycerol-3-phosphate dehydrogenase subunit GlpB [Candidatus Dormibacteria bacterium]
MSYDTVVVGAGLAGLTAALRLTEQGQRVLVVARGVGATHLAPATVDVLGYVGDARVESPASDVATLVASSRDHPYGHVPSGELTAALEWFRARTEALGYAGRVEENLLLPTALGVPKPSALAPRTMSGGDLRMGGRFVFVGFRGFKDFHPTLIADNIARARLPTPISARALELVLPAQRRVDMSGRLIAGQFDTENLSEWLVNALRNRVDPDEGIGMPAVLGLRRADEIWHELETRLERKVFEVATLPPSIAGIRLFDALTNALRAGGARIVLGVRAVGARTTRARIDAVDVANATGTVSHPTGAVVLASGGFASGGIELDSFGAARETVFDLPLIGIPETDRVRFAPGYFDAQPLAGAGVGTDDLLRPLDSEGRPVFTNLHAAGAILGGAVPWKEKSGTGISVATGYAAARAVLAAAAPAVAESTP